VFDTGTTVSFITSGYLRNLGLIDQYAVEGEFKFIDGTKLKIKRVTDLEFFYKDKNTMRNFI
jgi:hypothetical protein